MGIVIYLISLIAFYLLIVGVLSTIDKREKIPKDIKLDLPPIHQPTVEQRSGWNTDYQLFINRMIQSHHKNSEL